MELPEDKLEEFQGLPGIEEYLSSRGDGAPVSADKLEHITDALVAYCGFTREQSQRFVSIFFQEIRSSMLRGETVDIRGFGRFVVASPITTNNMSRVFPRFRIKKSLYRRLNKNV